MRAWLCVCGVFALGLGFLWAGGQGGSAAKGNEAAIRAAVSAYAAALKTGDLQSILANWAADAEFTDEAGKVHKGRAAIGKLFEADLKDLKAGKSVVHIEALRFLTADVATMEGAVEFTPENGVLESNRFSAVWTKADGRWLIASARDLPELEGNVAERGMKELQWLTGDWAAQDKGTTIKLNVKPDLGGKFAFMKYDIKTEKESMTVLQILGYDPVEASLRSWVFDSGGGYGESLWSRQNAVWTSETVGVLPTGQMGTSVNLVRVTSPDSFTWTSTQREVEGQPIPDHELKYTRVTKK
jgi:uncharacterized protein (TIGR02246 family)